MNELEKLHQELDTMKWIGDDEGWDLAINAVQDRISEIIAQSNTELHAQWSKLKDEHE